MSGPRGNTRCRLKLELKFRTLGSPQVSVIGSLHGLLTVLPLCFVCDALCVVMWDVVTAATHAVNEVWEPEAHSQLEKGAGGASRALTGPVM